MKLFEMKRRPEKAGMARINYDRSIVRPQRDGAEIVLPDDPELELFSLQSGKQFLVRQPGLVHFCGTDEQPFLVRLKDDIFGPFIVGGQASFYKALQAPVVKKSQNLRFRRQGDFFAIQLPFGLSQLEQASTVAGIQVGPRLAPQQCEGSRMFRTRHELTGVLLNLQLNGGNYTVVSGKLEAPDHRPMILPDLWILQQADNLYDPPNAD